MRTRTKILEGLNREFAIGGKHARVGVLETEQASLDQEVITNKRVSRDTEVFPRIPTVVITAGGGHFVVHANIEVVLKDQATAGGVRVPSGRRLQKQRNEKNEKLDRRHWIRSQSRSSLKKGVDMRLGYW